MNGLVVKILSLLHWGWDLQLFFVPIEHIGYTQRDPCIRHGILGTRVYWVYCAWLYLALEVYGAGYTGSVCFLKPWVDFSSLKSNPKPYTLNPKP